VLLTLMLPAAAGYAFARFRFRGGHVLFMLFVVLLIVPTPMSIIPLYVIVSDLHLMDTFFQYHVQWPYYFAGLSTAIIPIVVVYLVLQRQFISGMTAGAVRG